MIIMKTKRIISFLLSVLMLTSAFAINAFAEDEAVKYEYTSKTTNTKPSMDYLKGTTISINEETKGEPVNTKEKKLATMDLKLAKDGYLMYVDAYSGEIAVKCEATGEILFTNPYNLAYKGVASGDKEKRQLLSQLVVHYTDITTATSATFYSFEESAERGQVDVKNIKNGMRVEYAIGREQARMLVPCLIKKETFEQKILAPLAEAVGEGTYEYDKVYKFYHLYDPNDPLENLDQMYKDVPITKKGLAVYRLEVNMSDIKKALLEQRIKTYCPDYSYEDLDADHMETEYESEEKDPPLFKMALEYTIDEKGLVVRLPANGIRFNESLYQLENVEILPFMGAGINPDKGYTFFPDGSGALFDFETIASKGTPTTMTGTIYGNDYAYHNITGKHEETIRYPVFGIVETEKFDENGVQVFSVVDEEEEDDELVEDETGDVTDDDTGDGTGTDEEPDEDIIAPVVSKEKDRGFFAIVEEGDALMELSSYHAVKEHKYNTIIMRVNPRPKDTYNMADAISVGNNAEWTVVSSRKYTGSYKIRYIMLTDPDVAKEKGITNSFDCSYVGMAKAYRQYLEEAGVLTRLTENDVKKDIPLFIETFGAIWTVERILTIPVDTMAPLTSFENIKTMYEQLSKKNVSNINFVLKGYTDGGISAPEVPYDLDWEDAVGGEDGFRDLVADAKAKGYGIFPEFDFVFTTTDGWFDGFTLDDHAVKTIDNRYASKKVYSATKQAYLSYYEMAISPAYFSRFYEELTANYSEYGATGISVSTLGQYLNSDFDEDEPYNREDAKEFTSKAFEYLDKNYESVMTSGGNAFTWKYVDYIRDIALDSSRFAQAYASVPFLGMVLHGYVEFAGEPINMEGNTDYAMLKAIESGANLNFILSYQNTELLKKDSLLSQYYSIRYDIWFNDVVDMYNELNTAISGVQTSTIVGHKFLNGTRVPDSDELYRDAVSDLEAAIELEANAMADAEIEAQNKIMEARKGIIANAALLAGDEYLERILEDLEKLIRLDNEGNPTDELKILSNVNYYHYLKEQLETLKENTMEHDDAKLALEETIASLNSAMTGTVYFFADAIGNRAEAAEKVYEQSVAYLEHLKAYGNLPEEYMVYLESVVNESLVTLEKIAELKEVAIASAKAAYELVKDMEEVVVDPYEFIPAPDQSDEDDDNGDDKVASKYETTNNKIVVVTYENGTSFVLNFNDYMVTADIDGVKYTVGGYGYIVFKK